MADVDKPAVSDVYPEAGFGARGPRPAEPSSDHDPAHTLSPYPSVLVAALCAATEELAAHVIAHYGSGQETEAGALARLDTALHAQRLAATLRRA